MATHKGSEGTVKIGSNAIAEIRTWSINQTADTIEDTTMGDSARTYQSSLNTWDGSVDVFWDETDTTGQGACTIGTSITLNVYPEGATTGDIYFSGTAIVTGITRTASFDGMIESSLTFKGTGALSISTAS
jgi:predicted secreted protein